MCGLLGLTSETLSLVLAFLLCLETAYAMTELVLTELLLQAAVPVAGPAKSAWMKLLSIYSATIADGAVRASGFFFSHVLRVRFGVFLVRTLSLAEGQVGDVSEV